MVELIQMTEYLDDVPTWGQRDYRLYPPHYGDPFYRGRGRGRGNRGRREWIQERQMERPPGNSNRGNGNDNGIRTRVVTSTSVPQVNRQDDDWSIPPTAERRESAGRQQMTQASPLVAPLLQKKGSSSTGAVKVLPMKGLTQ